MCKVKTDGVKDNVEKFMASFNSLTKIKQESKIEKRNKLSTERNMYDSLKTEGNVVERVVATENRIMDAIGALSNRIEERSAERKVTTQVDSWTEVVRRHPKVKSAVQGSPQQPLPSKAPRLKNPAILVRTTLEEFPALAKKLRDNTSKEETGDNVVGMRQTRSGDMLIEIKGDNSVVDKIRREITRVAGDDATVNFHRKVCWKSRAWIAITNDRSDREVILHAVTAAAGIPLDSARVVGLRKSYDGSQTATVLLPLQSAVLLNEKGTIKVDFVLCRTGIVVKQARCFRCLSMGHVSSKCSGLDRRYYCHRCGVTGHYAARCTADPAVARTFAEILKKGGA